MLCPCRRPPASSASSGCATWTSGCSGSRPPRISPRWSTDVKPIAGTDLCEAPHFQYHVSGTLRVRTAEGVEFDATPGQVTALPAGHDAWVVGDEPVVVVDWWGASNYAKVDA